MTRRRTGLRAPTTACEGKKRYTSLNAAAHDLTALIQGGSHGPSLNAYRCPPMRALARRTRTRE